MNMFIDFKKLDEINPKAGDSFLAYMPKLQPSFRLSTIVFDGEVFRRVHVDINDDVILRNFRVCEDSIGSLAFMENVYDQINWEMEYSDKGMHPFISNSNFLVNCKFN